MQFQKKSNKNIKYIEERVLFVHFHFLFSLDIPLQDLVFAINWTAGDRFGSLLNMQHHMLATIVLQTFLYLFGMSLNFSAERIDSYRSMDPLSIRDANSAYGAVLTKDQSQSGWVIVFTHRIHSAHLICQPSNQKKMHSIGNSNFSQNKIDKFIWNLSLWHVQTSSSLIKPIFGINKIWVFFVQVILSEVSGWNLVLHSVVQ